MDQKEYMSMIGSPMYLTATRSDIHFAVCLCTSFQASPHISKKGCETDYEVPTFHS
jgi:hypothetical protein